MSTSPVARPSGLVTFEWLKSDTGSAHVRDADAYDPIENVVKMAMLSWDTVTLSWVKFTGAGGGGGGGGAATIADGADVAEGARGDTAWDGAAASATGISIWKATLLKLEAIRLVLAGTLTVGLPTGASTAARQDTGNTSVASIDTKTPALVGGRVPVDGSGVTQPISAAALPLPAGAATEAGNLATIAGKDFATQTMLALVKAKTDNLDVAISTINGTDINAPTAMPAGGVGVRGWLSAIWTKLNGSLAVTGTFFQATQPVSIAATVAVSGPATDAQLRATPLPVSGVDTTLGATVTPKAASVWDVSDRAARVLGVVTGDRTNNAAAPSTNNVGVLGAIANEALPSYAEGNLVLPAADLRGVLRLIDSPMAALGEYEWQGITPTYTGLGANTPLFSMRWGDATRLCQILRVEVLVLTSTSATTAGLTERQLVIARSFSASDTGGTAATLTGNNQKLRTSDATSLMTDLRIGGPITAGTRTLDAAPIAAAAGWSGLLSTGIVIGAFGSSPVGAARSTEGGGQFQTLYDEKTPGARKIVLAQNEGIVVRVGAAQPATAVQQTMIKVKWRETNKVY